MRLVEGTGGWASRSAEGRGRMTGLYPQKEPYEHGMLDVGDGNLVYWESCGSPDGETAVVLHGGPGSGCSAGFRRYFDPGAYRVDLLHV